MGIGKPRRRTDGHKKNHPVAFASGCALAGEYKAVSMQWTPMREPQRHDEHGAATGGARLCPPRTSRSGPGPSGAPVEIGHFPCGQPPAVGAPSTQPRSGKKPRGARGFRSAAFMPRQRERCGQGRTRDDIRTVKRRKRRAPLWLRLRRAVLQLCNVLARREVSGARASRPQQLRTCEDAINFQRPGSAAAAAAGTAALRCLRLRRTVFIASLWSKMVHQNAYSYGK